MRKIACFTVVILLLVCGLIACGVVSRTEASAPMAEEMNLVRTTLTALPEDLESVKLLARTSNLVLKASNDGRVSTYEYGPASGAYRRLRVPLEGEWKVGAMAAAPDGTLWTVFQAEENGVLMKSSQGNILIQCDLEKFVPETIVCDSVGHVFAATREEIRRYSPDGALQDTMELPEQCGKDICLVSQRERVFLRASDEGKKAVYWELKPDMTMGQSFDACVEDRDVWSIGSFLEGYTVMEADSVGLYAYGEDKGWETVCLWSERHLDGAVDSHLISDAQGNGVVQYEQDGQSYCLNLTPS